MYFIRIESVYILSVRFCTRRLDWRCFRCEMSLGRESRIGKTQISFQIRDSDDSGHRAGELLFSLFLQTKKKIVEIL